MGAAAVEPQLQNLNLWNQTGPAQAAPFQHQEPLERPVELLAQNHAGSAGQQAEGPREGEVLPCFPGAS